MLDVGSKAPAPGPAVMVTLQVIDLPALSLRQDDSEAVVESPGPWAGPAAPRLRPGPPEPMESGGRRCCRAGPLSHWQACLTPPRPRPGHLSEPPLLAAGHKLPTAPPDSE